MGEGETETDEETSANEHANTLRGGLEDSGDNLSIYSSAFSYRFVGGSVIGGGQTMIPAPNKTAARRPMPSER